MAEELLNRKINVRLYPLEYELYPRIGKKMPVMPTLSGVIKKRVRFSSEGYLVKLDEPADITLEGISRKLPFKTVSWIMFDCGSTDTYNSKDAYEIEFLKGGDKIKNSHNEIFSTIRAVESPDRVPEVFYKEDPLMDNFPVISWGFVSLANG